MGAGRGFACSGPSVLGGSSGWVRSEVADRQGGGVSGKTEEEGGQRGLQYFVLGCFTVTFEKLREK